jgi:hypothetical protein
MILPVLFCTYVELRLPAAFIAGIYKCMNFVLKLSPAVEYRESMLPVMFNTESHYSSSRFLRGVSLTLLTEGSLLAKF